MRISPADQVVLDQGNTKTTLDTGRTVDARLSQAVIYVRFTVRAAITWEPVIHSSLKGHMHVQKRTRALAVSERALMYTRIITSQESSYPHLSGRSKSRSSLHPHTSHGCCMFAPDNRRYLSRSPCLRQCRTKMHGKLISIRGILPPKSECVGFKDIFSRNGVRVCVCARISGGCEPV